MATSPQKNTVIVGKFNCKLRCYTYSKNYKVLINCQFQITLKRLVNEAPGLFSASMMKLAQIFFFIKFYQTKIAKINKAKDIVYKYENC